MRIGPAHVCTLVVAAFVLSAPAQGQDLGKIASDILHRATPGDKGNLTKGDVSAGLKEALTKAGGLATTRLSAKDGYMGDKAVRLPLPGALGAAQKKLGPFGMAGPLDDLQLKVNRAAEAAAPAAGKMVMDAAKSITFDDAMKILRGGDTAATDFLRGKTEVGLRASLKPKFGEALASSGALTSLDKAVAKYGSGLLKTDTKTWLAEEATTSALNGLFYYVAREEQAIRKDPVKRTSDLLRKVFGG
ncbi:MAG: DUF4197 domain-containing protein [Hyphomonadaceae bacterium]